MSQYDKLDAMILDRIGRANGATLTELMTHYTIFVESGAHDWNDRSTLLSSRLQDLRKSGLIRFSRPAWRLSERVRKEA